MLNKRKFRKHRPLFVQTAPKAPRRKKRWMILPIIWRSLKRTCMALGVMVLISIIFWGIALTRLSEQTAPPSLPSEMVLYLKLEGTVSEVEPSASFMTPFEAPPPTLRTMVDTLDRAADDRRIKGLLVRLNDVSMSLSQIQELRAAVKAFRASGKFAYIYASSYGGGIGGLGRLYLASAFDQRWMQPLGVVSMEGLRVEMPFFRSALDKIGVTPDFFQRKEYKTAYESATHYEMSAANKAALTTVVNAIRDSISVDMPDDLGVEPEAFDDYVDTGLFTAQEALDKNLITHLDYVDVLVDQIKQDVLGRINDDDDSLFVVFGAYAQDVQRKALHQFKTRAALIYASGAIVETNPSGRDNIAAADEIAPAILQAADDKKIKAIILRIDSPGGSPVASESILRAIHKAQEKGKKVIVSMGAMAASGGYWIASGADYIFAMPTTLTGSIGVVGGKLAVGEMWDKVGVNWDRSIQWGDNAGIWSMNEPFTPAQQKRVEAMLDQVYDAFLQRVAEGRNMSLAEADKIARGRVWPGLNAKDIGLVDDLGGLTDATLYTAKALGLPSADNLELIQMPRPLSPLEQLVKLLGEHSMVLESLRLQGSILNLIRPAVSSLDLATTLTGEPALTYAPVIID